MAPSAPFAFPRFSDGDVEIRFSAAGESYLLHSQTLSLHSTWFRASLSQRWNSQSSTVSLLSANKEIIVYELRFDKENDLGMLARKDATPAPDTELLQSTGDLPSAASSQQVGLQKRRVRVLEAHQHLLGMLYHRSPSTSFRSFHGAKMAVLALAKVAEAYDCEAVAALHVDSCLRRYSDDILDLCAKKPMAMLELAIQTKSEWIFKEAGTHLVGSCEATYNDAKPKLEGLEQDVGELMDEKRQEFIQQLKECELKLFEIDQGEHPISVLASSHFRQYLATRLAAGLRYGSKLRFGYALVYHTIAARDQLFEGVGPFLSSLFGGYNPAMDMGVRAALGTILDEASKVMKPILKETTRRKNSNNH